ncbi:glycosyltransferase family 9 protein [Cytobacillus oceanisediminis]|uniref:glycosyltransferase family 9 protein n=1 Tax=Cytobacillus oceanisediminis TaxID=665099 RepID=UPI001C220CAC|nr:glycosyltransferase family 9 protein [Cytobacillus oceanisediminis]MBU8772089.1 hypothetical protein [Cytobacillus oceanisediminis]
MNQNVMSMKSFITARKFMFLCSNSKINEILAIAGKFQHTALIIDSSTESLCLSNQLNRFLKCTINENTPSEEIYEYLNGKKKIPHSPVTEENYLIVLLMIHDKKINTAANLELLINFLPETFIMSRLHFLNTYLPYLVFTDKRTFIPVKNESKPNALIVSGGYGDGIMVFRIIQKFIDDLQYKGESVDIFTWDYNLYMILKSFLKRTNVYWHQIQERMSENRYIESIFLSPQYKHCYQVVGANYSNKNNNDQAYHYIDLYGHALGMGVTTSTLNGIPEDLPSITQDIKDWLEDKRKENIKLIGIQFQTQNKKRSWNMDYIEEFISLCKENNYQLINLAPLQGSLPKEVLDVSNLEVSQLFSVIGKLSVFVGIDSCCGHIAGVMKIPNLTIWGENSPGSVYINDIPRRISFRTLSMNYSLESTTRDINRITPEIVFKRMEDIIYNRIILKKSLITVDETIKGYGVEILGEKQ